MSAQDVIDKAIPVKNLLGQLNRLLTVIQNPTVEGVDISSSDFTTRYNAIKADLATAEAELDTAINAYTP